MRLQRPDGGAVGLQQVHGGIADFGDRLGGVLQGGANRADMLSS